VGHSSIIAWSGKYCLGCFCLLDIIISCLGLWDTMWCLLDKFILGCFCLRLEIMVSSRQKHLKQCLTYQATNKECRTNKFFLIKITLSLGSVTTSLGHLDRQQDWELAFPNVNVLHVRRVLTAEKNQNLFEIIIDMDSSYHTKNVQNVMCRCT
jgi:hypothetical protein